MKEVTFVSNYPSLKVLVKGGQVFFENGRLTTSDKEVIVQMVNSVNYKRIYRIENPHIAFDIEGNIIDTMQFNNKDKKYPNYSKKVSIIIGHRFKPKNLENCLESLVTHTPKGYQLILVLNEAVAESKDIAAKYQKIIGKDMEVIVNAKNRGFSEFNNQAVEKATRPYVLYLNDDTQVRHNWLDSMVYLLETIPNCGIVGKSAMSRLGNVDQLAQKLVTAECNVAFGYCMLLHREDAHFDEAYTFAGWEDIDLCEKIKREGKVIWVERCFPIVHLGRSSTGTIPGIEEIYSHNREVFEKKWKKQYT